ncbi:30S ribosomal protein S6 [Acidobacteriota bacterium]
MQRHYETLFIISSKIQDDDIAKVCKTMEELVVKNGGQVTKVEKWGKRKLAFEVKKHRDGYYVLLQSLGPSPMIDELERNMKLTDDVIRFLTVRIDDRLKLEAKKRKKAGIEEPPPPVAQPVQEAAPEAPEEAPPADEPSEVAPEAPSADPEEGETPEKPEGESAGEEE